MVRPSAVDQLVIGFDVGYKYASVLGFDDGVTQQFKLVDYVPIRARAGYAIGTFLPYALLGGAIGRFNHFNPSTGIGEDNAFSAGFLTGLGVNWLIGSSSVRNGNISRLLRWAVRCPK
ncbi:MAG: hypothetical protein WAL36_03425 [Pseudolabrys sp.]